MYTGSVMGRHTFNGHTFGVTAAGGIGYGGHRTAPGGNPPSCRCGGGSGLGCLAADCDCNSRGLGQATATEPTWGELFGTWAHGSADLVAYGFLAATLAVWLWQRRPMRRQ